MQPKHQRIYVQLAGTDGNALTILSRVQRAMHLAGVPADEIRALVTEATSRDYEHLLFTVMNYVEVD